MKPNSEYETRPRRDFWIWDQTRPRRDWIVKLFRDRDQDYWLIFKENETETETEHGSEFHTRPRVSYTSVSRPRRDRDSRQSVLLSALPLWKNWKKYHKLLLIFRHVRKKCNFFHPYRKQIALFSKLLSISNQNKIKRFTGDQIS